MNSINTAYATLLGIVYGCIVLVAYRSLGCHRAVYANLDDLETPTGGFGLLWLFCCAFAGIWPRGKATKAQIDRAVESRRTVLLSGRDGHRRMEILSYNEQ